MAVAVAVAERGDGNLKVAASASIPLARRWLRLLLKMPRLLLLLMVLLLRLLWILLSARRH